MRSILRVVGGLIALLLVIVVGLLVGARFADGPIAIIAGGPFTSGELVSGPEPDWSFVRDVREVEFQLLDPARSRTTWILHHEGKAYIPCGYMTTWWGKIWKQWPLEAEKDPRILLRVGDALYERQLVRIQEGPSVAPLLAELSRKYAGGREIPMEAVTSGYLWLYELARATDPAQLFSDRGGSYVRFVRFVRYPAGIRAYFLGSPLLRSGLRVLDAGCGTGIVTLALRDALLRRGLSPGPMHAFDLTPTMLERFGARSEGAAGDHPRGPTCQLHASPWKDYDLIVSASMLEYLPRTRLVEALRGLRLLLGQGGSFLLFITRRNWLTRPLIGRWWHSNLYEADELRRAFREAGFASIAFGRSRRVRYLALKASSKRRRRDANACSDTGRPVERVERHSMEDVSMRSSGARRSARTSIWWSPGATFRASRRPCGHSASRYTKTTCRSGSSCGAPASKSTFTPSPSTRRVAGCSPSPAAAPFAIHPRVSSWGGCGASPFRASPRASRSSVTSATRPQPRTRTTFSNSVAHSDCPFPRRTRGSSARVRPNNRLQLTAAGGGVRRPWPAAVGSG
jgi:SAM-dependent methyltransferase